MAANADGELVKLNAVVIKILAYCLAPLKRGLDVAGVRRRNVHLFARKTRLQVFFERLQHRFFGVCHAAHLRVSVQLAALNLQNGLEAQQRRERRPGRRHTAALF